MTEAPVTAALIDGLPADRLPLDDRAVAYGDGLFETILLHRGRPVWWSAHLERLADGARALAIAAPAVQCWQQDLDRLLQTLPPSTPERLLLKLVLSRGSSERGYALDPAATPRRIARLLPAPPLPRPDGITLRWCTTRLSLQPRLAGFKHLNRLEQVLARSEWSDPAIDEGLLCDGDGNAVSAIAGNLFVVCEGRLLTPPVDRCGVAGVCRRFLLEQAGAVEQRLGAAEVEAADELFICNSVRGILPVARLAARCWPAQPVTRALRARLAAADPAFAC